MKTLFFHCCFIILFVLVVGSQAAAQVKPLMENDQIKIYEATIKVGVKTLEHSHPADEATYVLSGGKGKVTLPDGTTKVNDYKTGEVTWRTAPETHVAENIGDTESDF
jgi:quercetin dioxygenase-like cupin family protein